MKLYISLSQVAVPYHVRVDNLIQKCKSLWNVYNKTCFAKALQRCKIYYVPEMSKIYKAQTLPSYHDKINAAFVLESGQPAILLGKNLLDMTEEAVRHALVHEMVHQHMTQVYGLDEQLRYGHGHLFMSYAPQIKRGSGIDLIA